METLTIKKKVTNKIVIEHKGITFTFRLKDGCDEIGFALEKSVEGTYRKVFTLLERVDGLKDDSGAELGTDRVLELPGGEIIAIGQKYVEELAKLSEPAKKNEIETIG